jgi:hypothetical protein
MFALYKHLLANQQRDLEEEAILRLLSPVTLKASSQQVNEEQRDNPDPRASLKHTIKAAVDLRLIQRHNGCVGLHPELPEYARDPQAGQDLFRRTLRMLVFSEDLNKDMFGSSEGPRDLVRAIIWYMLQDPYSPLRWDQDAANSIVQLQTSQLGGKEDWVLINDTRWSAFLRWATYLGFAWRHAFGGVTLYVPDPTVAILDVMKVLPRNEFNRGSLEEFIRHLALRLPVLDKGFLRQQFENKYKVNSQFGQDAPVCSLTLSLALLSLHEDGAFVMESLHDAPMIGLQEENGRLLYYSHVVR